MENKKGKISYILFHMHKENHLPGEREPVGEGRMDGEDYGGSDIYG